MKLSSALLFAVALLSASAGLSADTLRPNVSVVDYLKSVGQSSDFENRKSRFEAKFVGEKYTGSEDQNMRWLTTLIAEDKAAAEVARRATASASELAARNLAGEEVVSAEFACPGWVPAKGFGINGSYGYNVRVHVVNNRIEDRNLMVTLTGGVSNLGDVSASGKVEVMIDGLEKPLAEISLTNAWFPTIGMPGSITLYGKKGTSIELPQGKKISLRVTLNPIVKTSAGSVALWSCTKSVDLP